MEPEFRLEYKTLVYKVTYPIMMFLVWYVRARKNRVGGRIALYSRWWDGIPSVRAMREGAQRWPALDAVYNWQPPAGHGVLALIERHHLGGRGCQALRNRYKLVVSVLSAEIDRSIQIHGEARILSLAAGTLQSVLDASSKYGDRVKIVAIDKDESAIEVGSGLAKKFGVKNVEWRLGNVLKPQLVVGGFSPTVVEVVGLFDYLSDAMIVRLLGKIREITIEGGCLLTAHIHNNPEVPIIEELLDWKMLYRSKEHFQKLISKGGFEQAQYITEPHGIFTIVRGEVIR